MSFTTHKEPNALIASSSPYLLQHAYNPVKWFPWGEEALQKAKLENKLLLISIGYSSCHWCHVMEHESFEDEEVAAVMNKFFICIKVDREERPDIDQIYMDAVQLMTGRGGWPLNCMALADQRPIYGGTYFPKEEWREMLLKIADLFYGDPEKCTEYAEELTAAVRKMSIVKREEAKKDFNPDFDAIFNRWSEQFDKTNGGPLRAPKFPLPSNYIYLLRYWNFSKNENCKQHLELTLKKMFYGGIYDQLKGGFARYSTDMEWKVPHFEKMLYDNAQLVSLYSEAHRAFKNPLYKDAVEGTLQFIEDEMTSVNGGFYSALDADSEGVEGKFYIWKKEEIENVLQTDAVIFSDYFNVNKRGYWEQDYYILLRHDDDREIALRHNISEDQLQKIISKCKAQLLEVRNKRIKPGLDDKIICSWNAMMLKAYVDAYKAFAEIKYLNAAVRNADFIRKKLMKDNLQLIHSCKDDTKIYSDNSAHGFLDDYAFCIEAFIALYQVTFNENYLNDARNLLEYAIEHFSDDEKILFYFTADVGEKLISRKIELQDNVIPASNAVMASNLILLSRYFENDEFRNRAEKMLNYVYEDINQFTPWYSCWAQQLMNIIEPAFEMVINGEYANEGAIEFNKLWHPEVLLAGNISFSEMPLLKNRFTKNETLIYVCRDKTCELPVKSMSEAIALLKK